MLINNKHHVDIDIVEFLEFLERHFRTAFDLFLGLPLEISHRIANPITRQARRDVCAISI